jgi:hypothetical protein
VTDRLLTLAAVAARYAVSTRTARRMVARHDGSIAVPCRVRPMRWRASDVDAHLRRLTITDQLQQEARTA